LKRVALLLLVLAAVPAHAIVDPATERQAASSRIDSLRRQVEDLDIKIRTPGLPERDYSALQELRTNLEQERRLLEDREHVLERLEKTGVLIHLSSPTAAVAASSEPARSLWENNGWARFEGVLPCIGCDGIRTEITLYHNGLRYEMVETDVTPDSGRRTYKSEGVWTTLRGWKDDEDATVFELDYDRPGKERHLLRINDDVLKLVDLDESKLRKKPNLLLKRVAP
jgi:hypothetical protein